MQNNIVGEHKGKDGVIDEPMLVRPGSWRREREDVGELLTVAVVVVVGVQVPVTAGFVS